MLEFLLDAIRPGETALIEYDPLSSPELAFREIVERYSSLGYPILVVDILDTLHLFMEHLRVRGFSIPLDAFSVVKEGGRVRVGNILGEVPPSIDFEYHIARYSKAVRDFFMRNAGLPRVVIVLGLEKFIYPFQDDATSLERYFEVIERPLIAPESKLTFLFLNKGVVRREVLKSLEADKQHVVEVTPETALIKTEAPFIRLSEGITGDGLAVFEYTPTIPKGSTLLEILRTVDGGVVAVDIVDIGVTFWKAAGMGSVELKNLFDNMRVIKIGGRTEWGVVILKLDPRSDPAVIIEKISRKLDQFEGTILMFGIEHLPRIHGGSPRVVLGMFDYVSASLSDRNKRIICFINRELSDRGFLALLEDAATSVVDLSSGTLTLKKVLRGPSTGTPGS